MRVKSFTCETLVLSVGEIFHSARVRILSGAFFTQGEVSCKREILDGHSGYHRSKWKILSEGFNSCKTWRCENWQK